MQKMKIILTFVLCVFVLINNNLSVFASSGPIGSTRPGLEDIFNPFGYKEDGWSKEDVREWHGYHFGKVVQSVTDVALGEPSADVYNNISEWFMGASALSEKYEDFDSFWMAKNGWDDEKQEFNFDPDLVNAIRDWTKFYMSNEDAKSNYLIAYSYGLVDSRIIDLYQNMENYKLLLNYVKQYSDEYIFVISSSYDTLYCFPRDSYIVHHPSRYLPNSNEFNNPPPNYSATDGVLLYSKDGVGGRNNKYSYKCVTASKGSEFSPLKIEDVTDVAIFSSSVNISGIVETLPRRSPGSSGIVDYTSQLYKVYKSGELLKEEMVYPKQPSYYVGSNYNIGHVNAPVTYSINDIASMPNYGTINNYYSDYYEKNGRAPSDSEISAYMDKLIAELRNNNNSGSGGSGSNGSGSSGGDIFGFLGGIGNVFGSLIKGVGELITNLLTALTEVMTSLTTEVPDSVIGFMGSLMSWVPPDIWILVRLAMVLGLVMAVVKKFF